MRPQHWLYTIPLRLRSLFRRRRVESELSEEFRFHLEEATEEFISQGLAPQDARAAALRSLEGHEQQKEQCREARRVSFLEDLLQDVRFGLRTLRKAPVFAGVAILTLALGIGANTAIFSFISTLLMRSLPVADPPSLMLLQWTAHKPPHHSSYSSYGDCDSVDTKTQAGGCSLPEPMLKTMESQAGAVVSGIGAFCSTERITATGNGPASTIDQAKAVSGGFFQAIGIRPALGRLIAPEDDMPASPPVVVLSSAYWKNHFGSDPTVVGRTMVLNRVTFTIIGVTEPRFDSMSPGQLVDIWLPLASLAEIEVPWDHRDVDSNNWWLVVVARAKPGVSRASAQAALNTIFQTSVLHDSKDLWKPEDAPSLSLVPAQQGLTGEKTRVSTVLYVLMSAVGVVLLIACANVAGLLLSRAATRQREIALRFALGARPSRIVRQLLTESLLLSIAGGALGLLVANWIIAAITVFINAVPDRSIPTMPAIDVRVLAFTAGLSILTGVVFGLAPALRGLRVDLTPALKESSAGSLPSAARRFSTGNALVVAQIALTMIILAGAGLLVRTLQNLKGINPGFDTRNLVSFQIDPSLAGYKRPQIDAFVSELEGRLAALPGVLSASYSNRPLLSGSLWTTSIRFPGKPIDPEPETDMLPVGAGFFDTMRIPLLLGRRFTSADFARSQQVESVLESERVRLSANVNSNLRPLADENRKQVAGLAPVPAIVNSTFVQKFFPGRNPIGLRYGAREATQYDPIVTPGWEIVGVVGDARYNSLRREVAPTTYVPASGRSVAFTLRTEGDPERYVSQVRSIVAGLDSKIPVFRVRTMSQQLAAQLFQERLIARLSGFFGVLALGLACLGLYGLLSYEVARRTREIGIRIAMGADRRDVLFLVVFRGVALAAIGAALGLAAGIALNRFLGKLLYNVRPADPLTFVAVTSLLFLIAFLACYIPARRATRVDPMVALRYE